MKKVILLLLISLVLVGQAYSKPAFGLRLGLNSANATHGPEESNISSDSKTGIILGGALEVAINKKANRTIRFEAAYVQKGFRNLYAQGVGISGTAEVDEFVFTPAVIFRLSDAKTIPYLLVGADVGFTTKSKALIPVGNLLIEGDIPDWEGTDVSLDLGAGLLFPSGEGEFLTELRFSIGMTDMYPGDDWDPTTNNVEFILGYNFTVPK